MGKRRGDNDPRQLLFADLWVSLKGNGTQACRQAGYAGNDNVLAVTASRLLRRAKVQTLIAARLEKAVNHVHAKNGKRIATPERVMEVLSDQMESGRFFKVDDLGEPVIDLRQLEAEGKLHLIRKVKRRRRVRTYTYENGSTSVEETRDNDVELYSAQNAAEILGRYFNLEKRPPDVVPPMLTERTLVVAILESGDEKAKAALAAIARKVLPGPGVIDVEAKRG